MGFQRHPHEDQPQGIEDTWLRLFSSDGRSHGHQTGSITWHIFYTCTLRQSNAYQSYHQQAVPERNLWYSCIYGMTLFFVLFNKFHLHPSFPKRGNWWVGQGLSQKLSWCIKVHKLIFGTSTLLMKVFVLKKKMWEETN